MPQLTDAERAILAIEGRLWTRPGAKEAEIRACLDMSANRYHQLLNVLLDDPRALVHDPVLVNRLRRRRDAMRAARAARRAS